MVQPPPQRLACPRCKRPVTDRYDCPWDGSMAVPAETLDPGDPLQGEVVAKRHQVLFRIGQGGMGTVYSAWDTQASREVALKVIQWDAGRDPALIARFRREVAATQRLDHPNVVRLVDAGRTSSGWLFIAMERLYGRTLADFIRAEAPVPGPRAARLLVPVCKALEAAHALGMVHRDLKPANIFLAETEGAEELVKLLDFGIARAIAQDPVDDAISGTTVVGTVSYLAPEQARREPIDGRADLYALGIILYELVTGQPPFDFEAPLDTIRAHVESPVRSPRAVAPVNVSPALDALCLAMLSKRPDDRPATARDVRRLLLEAVREADAPPPVIDQTAKRRRRRRALLAAALGACVLLVYWLTV